MDLIRQTRTIGTNLDGLLIELGKRIAENLILRVLVKIARDVAVPFSYPWTLFQVKVLIKLNWGLLTFTVLYTSLQRSRLSPLAPIAKFYLRGVQLIMWTRFFSNIGMSLVHVFQHNHSREATALTMATRSAQALARLFSTPETEQSLETAYISSQMFAVTSTIIVQSTQVMSKPFSTRGTGTSLPGRSWSLWLAFRLVPMIRKLSSSGTAQPRVGNHTSPKVSL
jgi:hypothetical protein